ncbi:MAG TPA: hypothetical protein VFH38_00570 [Jatrophihabitans sp.]|nr:hypothetical protein [Jatrophihabitans sp.]
MGFMDKAKEAALQAKASAQQMAQQGQAKVQAAQQGRSEAELYRALGEAVFNEQRRGGDPAAVQAALDALDAHYAAMPPAPAPRLAPAPMAPGDTSYGAPPAPPAAAAPPAPPAAPPSSAAPPPGNFTLDDL